MTGSTLHVIRLALMHDIHRHQKALDRTTATETGGEDHRYALSDLRAAVADLEPRRRHRRPRLPTRSA